MRILHYIPTYAPAWRWGGPVISTASVCESLAALGHEVKVLTTDAGLDASFRDLNTVRNQVAVHYFPTEKGLGIHSPALERAVTDEVKGFDLLHVTGVWQRTSPAACAAARRAGKPFVISPRGALGPYSWRQKRLKKLIYYWWRERSNLAGAAGFHFTSQMEARECTHFVRHRPSAIIANAVLPGNWSREEALGLDWKNRNGLPGDLPLLLNVGRLHHKKGLDLLPAALASLKSLRWQLAFVGADNDGTAAQLAESFRKHGLEGRVHFLPPEPPAALPPVYSAGSLFLLPSRHENFGNVVIEALGAGCPVVVSDQVGNAADVALSGAAFVLPRSPAEWTKQIGDFLTGAQPRPDPAHTAAWTRTNFATGPLALQMERLYQSVLV